MRREIQKSNEKIVVDLTECNHSPFIPGYIEEGGFVAVEYKTDSEIYTSSKNPEFSKCTIGNEQPTKKYFCGRCALAAFLNGDIKEIEVHPSLKPDNQRNHAVGENIPHYKYKSRSDGRMFVYEDDGITPEEFYEW
jgi:hypothetical protein